MDICAYDREGKPITSEELLELLRDIPYRIIGKTELPDGREVSTVWLGMDHSFGQGPPLIFESLVFPQCDHMERYATEEEARAGHIALVAELSKSE
jgi:hypothetical protein